MQNAYWPEVAAILEQSIILPWRFRMFTNLKCASPVMAAILEQSIILPWRFRMLTDLKCASPCDRCYTRTVYNSMTIRMLTNLKCAILEQMQNVYWPAMCYTRTVYDITMTIQNEVCLLTWSVLVLWSQCYTRTVYNITMTIQNVYWPEVCYTRTVYNIIHANTRF